MKITIKYLQGDPMVIDDLTEDTTILEIKEKVNQKDNTKDAQLLKFVAAGKVLENSSTLSQNNIKDESTIYCIVSKNKNNSTENSSNNIQPNSPVQDTEPVPNNTSTTNANTTTNPFVQGQIPFNNMNPYSALSNENVNAIMQNPQFMNMMNQMMSDPELSAMMMESAMNPALLNDPSFMNRLVSNPRYMQLLSNNMGLFNMNNMFGQNQTGGNNFMQPPVQMPPSTPASNPVESRYEKEIDEMVALGFPNRAANLQCLNICNGDVNRAINLLLDMS
jgi:hypothetical protein